jgi:sugar lactone lactonase YvrE
MTTENSFEVVAELSEGPGNITITPDGRIIISLHQFYMPEFRVVEVLPGAGTRPFPNDRWSRDVGPDGIGLGSILGLRSDPEGVVWMLDNGSVPPKIVAWDTRVDALHRVIYLPAPVTIPGSFHNDLAVDPLHGAIYIADIAAAPDDAALVVVDLRTGFARRLLQGHVSTAAEDVSMRVEGQTLRARRGEVIEEPRVGINPITIDVAYAWVYYGAMHGTALYRVHTHDLLDTNLSPGALAARVERYGDKPPSDGISMDAAGNVYVTDTGASGIGLVGPDGSYRLLFRDEERLSWPDGISAGPDGFMYVTVNKLHRTAALNAGVNESQPPYYVIRFRPLGAAVVGR